MKIAITSTGDHPGAILDHRFGRCSYFVVYDTESKLMDFIPNPNKEIMEGAGPASIQLVASYGIQKVVSGVFGAKVRPIFDQLQIQMIEIADPTKTISEIIRSLY